MRSTMQEFPLTIGGDPAPRHRGARRRPGRHRDRRRLRAPRRTPSSAGVPPGSPTPCAALGITGDQRVGTFQWNNAEHLEAYLAVPSMGAVLHTLNIRLFPEQLTYIANHAEDKVVIVDDSLVDLLAKQLPTLRDRRARLVAGPDAADADLDALRASGKQVHLYEDLLAAAADTFDWPELDEHDAAAMCYTSGTTGNPKGVVYSHRSSYLHSMAVALGHLRRADLDRPGAADRADVPRERLGPALRRADDRRLAGDAGPLAAGRAAVPVHAARPGRRCPARCRRSGTTCSAYLDQHEDVDLSSHLRLVLCGGSAVPVSLQKALQGAARHHHGAGLGDDRDLARSRRSPGRRVGVEGEDEWRYRGGQGRLLPGIEGRIVGDAGDVLPRDGEAVGELEVRGAWVTGAYYKDDDPEKFRDGWLRTGDVGNARRARLHPLTDRSKDVIKSGGEWISSVDLENALMAHPDVLEAAVVGHPRREVAGAARSRPSCSARAPR